MRSIMNNFSECEVSSSRRSCFARRCTAHRNQHKITTLHCVGGQQEDTPMRQLTLAVAAGALLFATQANAGSFPVNTMTGIETGLVDTVAVRVYVHEGRRYCFYFDGWHGPGWYRCGFAWRQGIGWGGVYGWNSWSYGPYERRHHHHGNWQDHRRGDRIGVESGSTTRSRTSVEIRTAAAPRRCSKRHPVRANRSRQQPRAKHDRSWRCRCAIRRRRADTGGNGNPSMGGNAGGNAGGAASVGGGGERK